MLQRMMRNLRGAAVLGRDGALGALDDLYFDNHCWQVRYVVVATDGVLRGKRLLVSVACLARAATRDRVHVELSRARIGTGAGASPLPAAGRWLDHKRICSARGVIGFRIEAQDGSAGRLADLLVDEEAWSIDYLMVDTGKTAAPELLVPLDWVGGMDSERRTMRVQRTREQLAEVAPA